MHALSNMNMLSPDGQCYSFDHRGNGYSRGEGFGVLVLKRVADAIRDNDTIRGIIRSTGCNQDGHTPSLTLPNTDLQAKLIRDTYKKAGLSMKPTRFFEAHGTGTSVGDPIESKALGAAFRQVRTTDDPLWIGAIKSNIGHLEGASGVAGIIKAILVLEKAIIPPNTNFEKINPKIDAEFLRIQFPLESLPWPTKGLRRASVNSFGNAGTNSHVVLDDVYHFLEERGLSAQHLTVRDPPTKAVCEPTLVRLSSSPQRPISKDAGYETGTPRLLVFSTNDEAGIQRQAKAYADYFSKAADTLEPRYLDHLAYTLAFRRSSLAWKSFAVVNSVLDLPHLDKIMCPATKSSNNPGLGFIFTGQGAQWAGMGRELMAFPTFEESLRRSEHILLGLGCSWHLREEIMRQTGSRINETELAQPSCTALQIALLDLMATFGIFPTAVIGHSSGEIAAAYSTGALTVEAALKLAYYRGEVSGRLASDPFAPRGAMMSVSLSEDDVQPYLRAITAQFGVSGLTVACINSPRNVTISGDADQIDALKSVLDAEIVFSRKLLVRVAYHSSHMFRVTDDYRRAIQGLKAGTAPINPVAMCSSVTGQRVTKDDLIDPEYWVSNMVSPVQFVNALDTLISKLSRRMRKKLNSSHRNYFQIDALVEVGPHSALQGPINDTLLALRSSKIGYTSLLMRKNAATTSTFNALGYIKCLGYPIDMEKVNNLGLVPSDKYMVLPCLPEYVFDHSQKYWDESRLSSQYRLGDQGKLDLLGKPVPDWNRFEAKWRNYLRISEMSWMEDHSVNGMLIYPGAGMLVMAIEAANQMTKASEGVTGFEISEVIFAKPLKIPRDSAGVETQLVIHLAQDSPKPLSRGAEFRLFSYENSDWQECCHGVIRAKYELNKNDVDSGRVALDEVNTCRELALSIGKSCQTPLNPQEFYSALNESGLELGPSFHRVIQGSFNSQQVRAKLKLFQWPQNEFPETHVIHPASLDAIFHLGIGICSGGGKVASPTMIPTYLRRLFVSKTGLSFPDTEELQEYAYISARHARSVEFCGFSLSPKNDALLVQFEDLQATAIADHQGDSVSESLQDQQLSHFVKYQPEPDLLSPEATLAYCQDVSDSESPLERYVDMLAHKNGGLRILEIDTGDRTLTKNILQVLTVVDDFSRFINPRYNSFCFSSTSSDVLELGKKELQNYSYIKFTSLDMTMNKGEVYDIILASYSVREDEIMLRNISKMLTSGGKLFLSEPNAPLNENAIQKSPAVETTLVKYGFAYPGLELPASKPTDTARHIVHTHTTMSSGPSIRHTDKEVFVMLDAMSTVQRRVSDALASYWRTEGINNVRSGSLENAAAIEQTDNIIFVVLLELDYSFMHSITRSAYGPLKKLFQTASDMQWLTFSGGSEAGNPDYNIIHGLTRVLRNEYPDLNVTVLSIETTDDLSERQMASLTQILYAKHVHRNSNIVDVEYLEIGQAIHIPRIVPAPTITHELNSRSGAQSSRQNAVKDCPPILLGMKSVGILDTLHFVEDMAAYEPLAADEVEIRTHAIGMNYKDCLIALGKLSTARMGPDCAGVVTKAGANTLFQPGDRVMLAGSEMFRTFARGKVAVKIPHMAFTTAAAIPTQFGTAWRVIHQLAKLEKGETILIHAASGGTGQAAIQISQALGATVFATVGSKRKKDFLMDVYKIPEDHIFYSRDTSFAQGIKRITNGRGMDVIINLLVGEGLIASWECIAPYGRFIEIGKKDITTNSKLPMFTFDKNASFIAFEYSQWVKDRPETAYHDLQELVDMFVQHKFHTALPLRVHDISEIDSVFRVVQEGNQIGKFVLEVTPESQVQVTLNTKPSFQMDPDSTFVIAGGLGGLGRATARWMAERGARNIILLSRFGPRTDSARELIKNLQSIGVRVETPACDITDLDTMKQIFGRLSADMPPIKGVLQMSVIARDWLFRDLDYDDWKAAVDVKVVGSWNLHAVLPKGMDFFILLASTSGLVGIKGQTSYDAGNTYEDALARYRVSLGEKAISLDLGAMVDDGILAERPELLNRVLAYDIIEPVTRQKFYSILDYYCNPKLALMSPQEAQVVVGLGLGDGAGGLESVDHNRQPMLQPIILAGERRAAAGTDGLRTGDKVKERERFAASMSKDEAAGIVAQATIQKLAKSIAALRDGASINYDKPLQMFGVDSLLAIELRNWIVKEFDADIAVFETQGASTLGTLSMLVAGRSTIRHDKWSTAL
ncbi:putative polyketide synthase [Talaromyces proteolyticus]|uniref:Polyketide synthase n=1 Tax=Talaromyces proteolyticus TaxID=1131652 RepID=A0AAD4Q768_9EURO|nr:putative polyketide synthase [Talaromyces proteolyticus]KAH8706032.1 putative polyketide synthase [Talaromyces proteolyticus]